MPPAPVVPPWVAPAISPNLGVVANGQFIPLPQKLAERAEDKPFAPPLIASEQQASACWATSKGDRQAFGVCMVRGMLGESERAAYDCVASNNQDRAAIATCMIGALGGRRERAIAAALAQCQGRFGEDYSLYPLCVASQTVPSDGDLGRVIRCVEQQGATGNVDVLGTAICYGAGSLKLNAEAQIAVQCAVSTGGDPYAFAACAGGQLTAAEIDKCLKGGIGGPDGCFGPNNTIVKSIGSVAKLLDADLGPNNDLVKLWNGAYNDIRHGPGPNNEVVKVFRNVGNELGKVSNLKNEARKAVEKVVPRIRIKFKL